MADRAKSKATAAKIAKPRARTKAAQAPPAAWVNRRSVWLVVADASIMPTIPSVNTNLTALMIGERFGEWLRDGAV